MRRAGALPCLQEESSHDTWEALLELFRVAFPITVVDQMRESLELLPSWVLEQKAAANRQRIAVMRQRLAAGEEVVRMYQEPGLAWLQRQADAAEQLLGERQAGTQNS